MGRTNQTYRNHLDNIMNSFKPFKKALREENKASFDSLWEKAHSYSSAASYMNSTQPGFITLISMMTGLQKEIRENQKQLRDIQKRLDQQDT